LNVAVLVAARPNFVKAAPLIKGIDSLGASVTVVHAGQHYDDVLSGVFLDELVMPKPSVNLGVGSGSHAHQTAKTMLGIEAFLASHRTDALVVVGDVNATLAGAIAASKCQVPLVHLEAGLRSFDRTMPEEINRVVADQLSDLCLAPSEDAVENLVREGVGHHRIALVGNCMIDSLLENLDEATSRAIWESLELEKGGYAILTLHRPSNVDDVAKLEELIEAVTDASHPLVVVFPIHPRTAKRLGLESSLPTRKGSLVVLEPLSYIDFLSLLSQARLVFTDSGGIQEETSVLGIPCVTLRENTERPITLSMGTNRLGGTKRESIERAVEQALKARYPDPKDIPLWDGKAGIRSAEAILAFLGAPSGTPT
jgi:UDP-N-acetylglucosamine 2-epimerase (non-hydrolysing)